MNKDKTFQPPFLLFAAAMLLLLAASSCSNTKYLKQDQYLLKSNTVKIKLPKGIANKGEIKDNLTRLAAPKPNSKILGMPVKLWLYNARYKKYQDDPTNFQVKSKTAEKPSLLDTSVIRRSTQNMKNYLLNKGFFYSTVDDTFRLHKKKAYVTYKIETHGNYLINTIVYDVDDSAVAHVLQEGCNGSGLKKDKPFSNSLLDEERTRLTALLRDHGYYRFSQENISFVLDTLNTVYTSETESPIVDAFKFITLKKAIKKPTLNITTVVRHAEADTSAYITYRIANVTVLPDYIGDNEDTSTLRQKIIDGVRFKTQNYYVRENVLLKHIYLLPGSLYKQSDYDKTIIKLNELGIFQYIRIRFAENKIDKNTLDCTIQLSRTKKYDFSPNYEVSSGTTYSLGQAISLNFRDRNFAKGANLLSLSASGGLELIYSDKLTGDFFNHFYLLTKYYGLNASLDFPKFLAPIAARKFNNTNLPHTIFSIGTNLIDRVDYFTLTNTNASFSYNWHESQTKTWNLSPAFINVIRLPQQSDSFKARLEQNQFLRDSYKENFIEGENISFSFSNIDKNGGRNYSFLKLGLEEAGGLLSLANGLGTALNDVYNIKYAQYTKLDFDARHYFTLPLSTFAFRFFGGVGLPYGQSQALPYIKQYYVGGPYSIRGWRIRSLGPGSSLDTSSNLNYIDRTGDIKLELNGEFRFGIAPLFAGAIKWNGALFADAGNIWVARKDAAYPGGEFDFSRLGQETAVSIGAGARFDIASFITVRLDAAFPVKKPYVFNGNGGWVFNQISPFDPTWRSNNLIVNFAIGYPF